MKNNLNHILFSVLMIGILLLPLFSVFVEGKQEEGQISESKDFHIFMYSDDTLNPMIPMREEEVKRVEAVYDDYEVIRTNRQWTDIGTWTSEPLINQMKVNSETFFILWVSDAEENQRDDCEFRFTVKYNEQVIGQRHIENQTVPETPTKITTAVDVNATTFEIDDKFSIYLEYRGWDDIDVYYDNETYDSGININANPITIYEVYGKLDRIGFRFTDAFDNHRRFNSKIYSIMIDDKKVEIDDRDVLFREYNHPLKICRLKWLEDFNSGNHNVKVILSYGGDTTWEISKDIIFHEDPTAIINKISPNPAGEGEIVWFYGNGTDDGTITEYYWESNINGFLSDKKSFSLSNLSIDNHYINFKVKDNYGVWSNDDTLKLVVEEKILPIYGIELTGENKIDIKVDESKDYRIFVENTGTDIEIIQFSLEYKMKNWIFVEPDSLSIRAGKTEEVVISFEVPQNVKEGDYKLNIIASVESFSTVTDELEVIIHVEGEEQSEKDNDDDFIPGFEFSFIIAAFCITYIIKKKFSKFF